MGPVNAAPPILRPHLRRRREPRARRAPPRPSTAPKSVAAEATPGTLHAQADCPLPDARSHAAAGPASSPASGATTPASFPVEPPVPLELPEAVPLLDPDPLPDPDPLLETPLDPELDPELDPLLDPELEPLLEPELDPLLDPELLPELLPDPMATSLDASGVPTPVGPSHPGPAWHRMSLQKPLLPCVMSLKLALFAYTQPRFLEIVSVIPMRTSMAATSGVAALVPTTFCH